MLRAGLLHQLDGVLGGRANILGAAEAKDDVEDDGKEQQAKGETDTVAESLGELMQGDNVNHDHRNSAADSQQSRDERQDGLAGKARVNEEKKPEGVSKGEGERNQEHPAVAPGHAVEHVVVVERNDAGPAVLAGLLVHLPDCDNGNDAQGQYDEVEDEHANAERR